MPSLLKQMCPKCIAKVIKEYEYPGKVKPAILRLTNAGCLKLGEFCSYITSLLISNQFIITYSNDKPLCLHSNIMMLSFGSSIVTFVDRVAYMEIHVDAKGVEQSRKVCSSIIHFFHPEIKTEHKLTFLCPCKPNDDASCHLATLFIEDKVLQCSIIPTKRFSLDNDYEVWFENTKGKVLAIFNYGKKSIYKSFCKSWLLLYVVGIKYVLRVSR